MREISSPKKVLARWLRGREEVSQPSVVAQDTIDDPFSPGHDLPGDPDQILEEDAKFHSCHEIIRYHYEYQPDKNAEILFERNDRSHHQSWASTPFL